MSAVGISATGTARPGFIAEMRAGGWRTLLAGFIGVSLGITALPFYTLGVFSLPVAAEFHWSRAEAQSGLMASMIGTVCAAGLAGWAIDRFGARRVALVCQVGLALGLYLLSSQTGSVFTWRASWFVMAVMAVGTTPLTWSTGIAAWFTSARGLALGIALSGTGFTAMCAPPLVQMAIAAYGWRTAYLALAGIVLFIAWPSTLLLFRTSGRAGGPPQAHEAQSEPAFRQVLRGYRFWLIFLAFAAVSFGVGGTIPNLVPMLIDAGVTEPALYASILGAMVILGRLASGYLLDRFWAPAIAVAFLSIPALACVLLAKGIAPAMASAFIGLAGGAEFDLVAYLCATYFGMRSFGRVYAWQWAGFALAAGAGALCMALARDSTGSYAFPLYLAASLMAGGGASLLTLGRYPRFGIITTHS